MASSLINLWAHGPQGFMIPSFPVTINCKWACGSEDVNSVRTFCDHRHSPA